MLNSVRDSQVDQLQGNKRADTKAKKGYQFERRCIMRKRVQQRRDHNAPTDSSMLLSACSV